MRSGDFGHSFEASSSPMLFGSSERTSIHWKSLSKSDARRIIAKIEHSEVELFQWSDPQSGTRIHAWGRAYELDVQGRTTFMETGLSKAVRHSLRELFTNLRTTLDPELHKVPIGYFAKRFDPGAPAGEQSVWTSWPRYILRFPGWSLNEPRCPRYLQYTRATRGIGHGGARGPRERPAHNIGEHQWAP